MIATSIFRKCRRDNLNGSLVLHNSWDGSINNWKIIEDGHFAEPSNFLKSGPTDESRLSTVHLKNLVSVYTDKTRTDSQPEQQESNEYLLDRLQTTNELAEQGEILFILYQREGLDWEAEISDTETYTVKQMLIEVRFHTIMTCS